METFQIVVITLLSFLVGSIVIGALVSVITVLAVGPLNYDVVTQRRDLPGTPAQVVVVKYVLKTQTDDLFVTSTQSFIETYAWDAAQSSSFNTKKLGDALYARSKNIWGVNVSVVKDSKLVISFNKGIVLPPTTEDGMVLAAST